MLEVSPVWQIRPANPPAATQRPRTKPALSSLPPAAAGFPLPPLRAATACRTARSTGGKRSCARTRMSSPLLTCLRAYALTHSRVARSPESRLSSRLHRVPNCQLRCGRVLASPLARLAGQSAVDRSAFWAPEEH